jgi:hypothetical protein
LSPPATRPRGATCPGGDRSQAWGVEEESLPPIPLKAEAMNSFLVPTP